VSMFTNVLSVYSGIFSELAMYRLFRTADGRGEKPW